MILIFFSNFFYRSLGAVSSGQNEMPLVKVAAVNALARCTRYVDTHFTSKNIRLIIEKVKDATTETDSTAFLDNLDLVRIAGQGRAAITHVPTGSSYYQKDQNDDNENDQGWWKPLDGIQLKRPQMGQAWRVTQGLPIFYDLT